MLESSIILVAVILLLVALLSLSFYFYQLAMMNSVATEIAADIAKNYKYTEMDMGSKKITLSDVEEVRMFRMNLGSGKIEKEHIERAETYAPKRIKMTSLGFQSGKVDVECEITHSGIGRAYVTVKVSQDSDFFMSGILEMLDIVDDDTFSATAVAECVDLSAYTSNVIFTEYCSKRLDVLNGIGTIYTNIKEIAKKLMD